MTTIAFDGEVLAADGVAWDGTLRINVNKLNHVTLGENAAKRLGLPIGAEIVWAHCGNLELLQLALQWMRGERDMPDVEKEAMIGLIVDKSSGICYGLTGIYTLNHYLVGQVLGAGSGAKMAVAAMEAGATATGAIEITKRISDEAGGVITYYTLPDAVVAKRDGVVPEGEMQDRLIFGVGIDEMRRIEDEVGNLHK